jgi:hypothetical protein
MRTVSDPQMELGQVAIADIKLDPKSRDDIPQLLQHLHADPEPRKRVFAILEGLLPGRGRKARPARTPGAPAWRSGASSCSGLRSGPGRRLRPHPGTGQPARHPPADAQPRRLGGRCLLRVANAQGQPDAVHAGDTRPDQPGSRAGGAPGAKKKPGGRAKRAG